MATIKIELEITVKREIVGAERERYLCASLEEGIENGWHEFLMDKNEMPIDVERVNARVIRR